MARKHPRRRRRPRPAGDRPEPAAQDEPAAAPDQDEPASPAGFAAVLDRAGVVSTCLRYVLAVIVLSWLSMFDAVADRGLAPLRNGLAAVLGGLLRTLGATAHSRGSVIDLDGASLQIVNACMGIDATALLVAAVVVFPVSWRWRARGVLLAVAVMAAVNFVRLLSLCLLGAYSPSWLDVGHLYVWPTVIMLVGVATLLLWIERAGAVAAVR